MKTTMTKTNPTTTLLPTTTAAALLLALFGAAGCATPALLPPPQGDAHDEQLTLLWVGRGECERLEDGVWVRRPEFDYDFSVEQHRFADRWESVKSMRRRHPDYDGSAGERAQTLFFRLSGLTRGSDGAAGVAGALSSSLGDGTVVSDGEFREARLDFAAAGVSSLAPFDRYRITQHYDYEGGRLEELVELNDGSAPWVRNREVARLYAAHTFAAPPTTAPTTTMTTPTTTPAAPTTTR